MVSIRGFLSEARTVVIAVVDGDGAPWAVPVGVRSYSQGRFEWVSMIDTVHSQAIERNEKISLTVFIAPVDINENFGFYAKATAKKVSDLGGGAAIYEAQCDEAWYNDHTRIKTKIDIKEL